MGIFAFFLSPIGRYVGIGLAALSMLGGIYLKGRWDQRAADKIKLEKEISQAIEKGEAGRAEALKNFNDNKIPNSWFRDD